jgi:hypothetical protein
MTARLVRFWSRSQWPMLLGPLVGITFAIATGSSNEFWVDTDDDSISAIQFIALGVGCVLGLVSFVFDQLPHLREYVLHRGESAAMQFWSRAIVALFIVAICLPGALALGTGLYAAGPNGALVTFDSVMRLVALSTSAFLGLAFGAWCATLRGSAVFVATIAVLAAGAIVGLELSLVLVTADDVAPSATRYVVFQLVGAAAFLGIASVRHMRPNDVDLPTPLRAQAPHAVVVSMLFAALTLFATPPIVDVLATDGPGYPYVVRRAGESLSLADVREDGRLLQPLDAAHEPVGDSVPRTQDDAIVFVPHRLSADRESDALDDGVPIIRTRREFALGVSVASLLFHPFERVVIEQPSGKLVFARFGLTSWNHDVATRIEPVRETIERPDGKPFGLRPTVLAARTVLGHEDFESKRGSFLLGDLDDGTLWRVTFRDEPRRIDPVALPGGDRFVAWAWKRSSVLRRDATARFADYDVSRDFSGQLEHVVVVGERANYVVRADGALEVTDEPPMPWIDGKRSALRLTPGGDPFVARFDIVGEDGAVVFSHEYAPRRPREHAARGLALAVTALRPAPLARLEVAGLEGAAATAALARPVMSVACAVVLAALGFLRLRRLGAEPARRVFWTALIAVFGPVGFLTFVLLESKSAFARIPKTSGVERKTPMVLEGIANRA